MLTALDVRFVVSPTGWPLAGPGSPFVERARFGDQVISERPWTPEIGAALGFTASTAWAFTDVHQSAGTLEVAARFGRGRVERVDYRP